MNVVFDLGGVVFNWQPQALVRRVYNDAKIESLVLEQVIGHADWLELDRGSLALEDAISRGASRTGLPGQEIARLFAAVPVSLTPIDATIKLLHELHNNHLLYVLSNMHLASADYLEANHDIWQLFNGVVFSCRIQEIKPEPGIYAHLLDEHQLVPAETVFIDDLQENLDAASAFGIRTVRFVDPAQCRADLTDMRCL